jgi:hypothetical protein
MSDPRQMHYEAVEAAIYSIGEMQDTLAGLTDKTESTIGAVIMAVGQNPNVASAQAAMNAIQEVKVRIGELFRLTEHSIEEMRNYSSGI